MTVRRGGTTGGTKLSFFTGIESEREEIRQCVANFKTLQQRLIREREDYADSQWKRMLASQREANTPSRF